MKKKQKSALVIALRSSDIRTISKISFQHTHPEWPLPWENAGPYVA